MAHSSEELARRSACTHGVWIAVLWLTLVLRLAWLQRFPVNPTEPIDAEGYHLLALNLIEGRGFAIGWGPPLCPTAVRTPLYPMFLVFAYRWLGQQASRAVLLQALLEVLTAALCVRMAQDWGRHIRIATAAGLLYTFNGSTQRYVGYLLSESLLLPLTAAAVLLSARCLRRPRMTVAALSAALWGAVLLTKPNLQYLVLVVGGLLTLRWAITDHGPFLRRLARAGTFWVGLLVVLAPWLIRNRLVLGRWLLSTAFEENLARVAMVAVRAEAAGVVAEPWTETWEAIYRQAVADVARRFGWCERTALRVGCAELAQRQRQVAIAAREEVGRHWQIYARAHFRGVLWSVLDPAHRTWYHVLTGLNWEDTGVAGRLDQRMAWALQRRAVGDALHAFWLERVVRVPFSAGLVWWTLAAARLGVWVGALRGLLRLRRDIWIAATVALTVGYVLLLPGPIAYDRFYLPAIPLVATLVSLGIAPSRRVAY